MQSVGVFSFCLYLGFDWVHLNELFFDQFKVPPLRFPTEFNIKLAFDFPKIFGFSLVGIEIFETALAVQILTLAVSLPERAVLFFLRRDVREEGVVAVVRDKLSAVV